MRQQILKVGAFMVTTGLFLVAESDLSAQEPDIYNRSPQDCMQLLKKPAAWRRFKQKKWGEYDLQKSKPILKRTREWNNKLNRKPWSLARLKREGLLEIRASQVATNSDGEKIPFYEMYFPQIQMGLYFPSQHLSSGEEAEMHPERSFRAQDYDAIAILLPGIGSKLSLASGMTPLARSLTKVGRSLNKVYLGDSQDPRGHFERGFRAYSVMFDVSLNGLSAEAPPILGLPEGQMLALRHAQLILKQVFSFNKFVILGRSQGGLNAMAYARLYGPQHGFYGAVACNPSSTRLESIKYSQYLVQHLETANILGKQNGVHVKSWRVHNEATSRYDIMGPSRAPVLVLHAPDDTLSYPQDKVYQPWLRQWQRHDAKHHFIERFEDIDPIMAHNLWNPDGFFYPYVMGAMANFFNKWM